MRIALLGVGVIAAAALSAERTVSRPVRPLAPPASPAPARRPAAVPATGAALATRLERVSRAHLGCRYRLDPLGEGPSGTVDRDPLKNWNAVDCVTFVEQCLAEALAPSPREADGVLRRIRYRDGVIAFESRNHFTVVDWIPNNAWFVRDVTAAVGGADCRSMAKTIDPPALARQRGGQGDRMPPARRLATRYLPRAAVPRHAGAIPHGSLLVLITSRPGVFASHVGFVFTRGSQRLFRHASQLKGKVIEEPLLTFLARSPRSVVGVKVCTFYPSATAARRGP